MDGTKERLGGRLTRNVGLVVGILLMVGTSLGATGALVPVGMSPTEVLGAALSPMVGRLDKLGMTLVLGS